MSAGQSVHHQFTELVGGCFERARAKSRPAVFNSGTVRYPLPTRLGEIQHVQAGLQHMSRLGIPIPRSLHAPLTGKVLGLNHTNLWR